MAISKGREGNGREGGERSGKGRGGRERRAVADPGDSGDMPPLLAAWQLKFNMYEILSFD